MPPSESIVEVHYTVEPNYAGWRLDQYLCEKIKRASRTRVQEIIARDLVADRPLRASTRVAAGLSFRLRKRVLEEPATADANTIGVLYQDEQLLGLNKPAGLPMHPTARYHASTVVAWLQAHHPHAHPAHRLDRETSGIVVCGVGSDNSRKLFEQFVRGDIQKTYWALVEGHPPSASFSCTQPLSEGTEAIRIAVKVDPLNGKTAHTDFRVVQRGTRRGLPYSLLHCFPKTGRQHQIRAHLQHLGFPLVGDKIYGPDPLYFDRFSKGTLEPAAWERLQLPRHALHAAALELKHPLTGAPLTWQAPMPPDLQQFLNEGSWSP